jgi:hypothetical protein
MAAVVVPSGKTVTTIADVKAILSQDGATTVADLKALLTHAVTAVSSVAYYELKARKAI